MTLDRTQSAPPTDETLIIRVQRQDQDALMALYERYGGQVYGVALRVLGSPDSAEEVAQDVFLRVWRQPQRWDPTIGSFPGWLLTVTRNAAIDRLRKEQRRIPRVFDDISEIVELPSDPPLSSSTSWYDGQILTRLLQKLPDEQRELVELAYYWGYTHSELSEQLQLPLGTVKTRLRGGLIKLRALWLESEQGAA